VFEQLSHCSGKCPSPNELEHDRLFLCEHLPEVKTHLGIEIPNLLRQVDSRDFYTRETCNEFHLLLCRPLTLFLDALYDISKLREPVANLDCLDKIYEQLDLITLFGLTLKSMIGGTTMKKHLRIITEFFLMGRRLESRQRLFTTGAGRKQMRKRQMGNFTPFNWMPEVRPCPRHVMIGWN